MDLNDKKCKPCEGGLPPLTTVEINELRKSIAIEWAVEEGKRLRRAFFFVNFRHGMDFVNKVADLAEDEGHHPVIHVYYARIVIELWTHAIDGLSENDFILASKIDRL